MSLGLECLVSPPARPKSLGWLVCVGSRWPRAAVCASLAILLRNHPNRWNPTTSSKGNQVLSEFDPKIAIRHQLSST